MNIQQKPNSITSSWIVADSDIKPKFIPSASIFSKPNVTWRLVSFVKFGFNYLCGWSTDKSNTLLQGLGLASLVCAPL